MVTKVANPEAALCRCEQNLREEESEAEQERADSAARKEKCLACSLVYSGVYMAR